MFSMIGLIIMFLSFMVYVLFIILMKIRVLFSFVFLVMSMGFMV